MIQRGRKIFLYWQTWCCTRELGRGRGRLAIAVGTLSTIKHIKHHIKKKVSERHVCVDCRTPNSFIDEVINLLLCLIVYRHNVLIGENRVTG